MDATAIASFIRERVPDVIAVYQFGSQAQGRARRASDVDIAILARVPVPGERLFHIGQDLATHLHCDVDLLDLRAISTVMRMQVLAKGQRLATNDARDVAEFEMYAYADYARLNEERKRLLKDVKERGLVYG